MPECRVHTDVCGRADENEMRDLQALKGDVQIGSDEPVVLLFLGNDIPLPGFQFLDDIASPGAVAILRIAILPLRSFRSSLNTMD